MPNDLTRPIANSPDGAEWPKRGASTSAGCKLMDPSVIVHVVK